MQTLAKLQLELGLLLDEAQIGQVELQNMVEHLGRQHQRLEKHMFETATTHRRHHSKPSYCPSLAFLLAQTVTGVNPAGDAGDTSPNILFGGRQRSMGISPQYYYA